MHEIITDVELIQKSTVQTAKPVKPNKSADPSKTKRDLCIVFGILLAVIGSLCVVSSIIPEPKPTYLQIQNEKNRLYEEAAIKRSRDEQYRQNWELDHPKPLEPTRTTSTEPTPASGISDDVVGRLSTGFDMDQGYTRRLLDVSARLVDSYDKASPEGKRTIEQGLRDGGLPDIEEMKYMIQEFRSK